MTADQQRYLTVALRLVRWALPLLLVVWLAVIVVESVYLGVFGSVISGQRDPAWPNLETGMTRTLPVLSRSQVSNWQLFGSYEQQPVTSTPTEDAPDTRLQLELVGLFVHKDPELARAVIAESGKEGQLLKPGDPLPGNARLEAVYADRVTLRRQGQLESLRLRDPELTGVESQPMKTSGSGSGPVEDPVEMAADFESLAGNPAAQRQAIIQQLALAPVVAGTSAGYQITDDAPRELIGGVGLRVGDRVLSVNGHALGEEYSDIQALNDVMSSGRATIEVQRGSRRFTVSYPP